MKLYKISQKKNNEYDYYEAFIVCAESDKEAVSFELLKDYFEYEDDLDSYWVTNTADVICEEIGTANDNIGKGDILGSYRIR